MRPIFTRQGFESSLVNQHVRLDLGIREKMGDSSDEDAFDPQDADFYKQRLGRAVFLLREHGKEPEEANKEKKLRKQERKRERAELDELEDRPRVSKAWEAAEVEQRSQGLPIKLPDGSIKKVKRDAPLAADVHPDDLPAPLTDSARKKARRKAREAAASGEDGEMGKQTEAGAKQGQGAKQETQQQQQQQQKQQNSNHNAKGSGEKKLHMGQLCAALLRDPESNIGNLKQLLAYTSDADSTLIRLSIVSLTAVFVDVVPGYRIRLPTEKELQVKVSKQVAAQRKFESTLLHDYQRFLQCLEAAGRKNEEEAKALDAAGDDEGLSASLTYLSVSCMARLLSTHPHFNFSSNIMQSLIRRLESPVNKIFQAAHGALSSLLSGQVADDKVRECVGLIADLVKRKQSKVRPQVLSLLLHLRISSDMLEGDAKKKKGKKGEDRDEEEEERRARLMSDMAEGEAEVSKDQLKEAATKVLDTIFVAYFRVLKMGVEDSQALLPPVLEGLSRFAHLINVDFFSDLMQAIKSLIAADEGGKFTLSLESSLHCVLCVFRCLKTQGEVWDLDLQDFYDTLFSCIPRISSEKGGEAALPLLIQALTVTLWETRQLSSDRVAGFVKRMFSVTAHLPPSKAIPLLALSRKLCTRYPKVRRLVDIESSSVGVYNPDVSNAELSNAFASTAWELSATACSYHPDLAKAGREIAGIAEEDKQEEEAFRVMVTARGTEALLRSYSTDTGGFNPSIQLPATHPLTALSEKAKRKQEKEGGSKEVRLFFPTAPKTLSAFAKAVLNAGAGGEDAKIVEYKDPAAMSEALFREFKGPRGAAGGEGGGDVGDAEAKVGGAGNEMAGKARKGQGVGGGISKKPLLVRGEDKKAAAAAGGGLKGKGKGAGASVGGGMNAGGGKKKGAVKTGGGEKKKSKAS